MSHDYRVTFSLGNDDIRHEQYPFILAGIPIEALHPIRRPNNYHGQRHITGLHFSHVTALHHTFESRLEQSALIRIDFELNPLALATQPFALLYTDKEKRRGHIPDILVSREDGSSIVIDVKPKAFVSRNAKPFSAVRDA